MPERRYTFRLNKRQNETILFAHEQDGSWRVVPLTNSQASFDGCTVQANIPLSSRYLLPVLRAEVLGELDCDWTCLNAGVIERYELGCPGCHGYGGCGGAVSDEIDASRWEWTRLNLKHADVSDEAVIRVTQRALRALVAERLGQLLAPATDPADAPG